MTKILLVTSSPRDGSLSSRFAAELAKGLSARKPGVEIIVRDLAATPLPHIDNAYIAGRMRPAAERTFAEGKSVAVAEELVAELFAADIVIIGSGMINFGLSSQLKAWIDYVTWPGVTFSYGPNGVEGKLAGKKAYVIAASGGVYSSGPMAAADFQTPYLKHMLGFLGLTDVEQISVEGLALGAEAAEGAIAKAGADVSAAAAQAA